MHAYEESCQVTKPTQVYKCRTQISELGSYLDNVNQECSQLKTQQKYGSKAENIARPLSLLMLSCRAPTNFNTSQVASSKGYRTHNTLFSIIDSLLEHYLHRIFFLNHVQYFVVINKISMFYSYYFLVMFVCWLLFLYHAITIMPIDNKTVQSKSQVSKKNSNRWV